MCKSVDTFPVCSELRTTLERFNAIDASTTSRLPPDRLLTDRPFVQSIASPCIALPCIDLTHSPLGVSESK